MRYEMWILPEQGGEMLHACEDPAEMFVFFKDALRAHEPHTITLLANDGEKSWQIHHRQLRAHVLRRTDVR